MANITISLQEFAGQSGLTLDVLKARHREVIESGVVLAETSAGVFEGSSVSELPGTVYILEILKDGLLVKTLTYRASPVPPTHDSEHMPDGSADQVLIHNGTEFRSVDNDVISDLVADDIQGYYGLLTNFYFTGAGPLQ